MEFANPMASSSKRSTKKKPPHAHFHLVPKAAPRQTAQIKTESWGQEEFKDFEEQSWERAFENTVFSQFCPPDRQFRIPTSVVWCDFDKGPAQGGEANCSGFNRVHKESFDVDGCEDLRTQLENKVHSFVTVGN
jgi:hypothetical protein